MKDPKGIFRLSVCGHVISLSRQKMTSLDLSVWQCENGGKTGRAVLPTPTPITIKITSRRGRNDGEW